ncbi:MAG: single-stranded DNA-binding protein [Candidatus Obscuribacterales bacterium]|jgi:single-stranded DNA-binding protein
MTAQITVKGIVGINPELKEFQSSKKARFTVASSTTVKGQPVTTWFNAEAWNGDTELIMERIAKGQLVEVTGKLRLNLYRSQKHNKQMIDATIAIESFRILPREQQGSLVQELTA